MRETVRFLERSNEVRRSAAVLITPGRAEDVLATTGQRTLVAAEGIRLLLDRTEQTGVAFNTSLRENILLPLAINGIEPIASRVIATQDSSGGKAGSSAAPMPEDQGSQGLVKQKQGVIRVSGMAAFKGNELVGWLNEKESRGWGWIMGRVRRGYTATLDSTDSHGESEQVTFHLLKGKSKVKTTVEDGQAAVNVTVKVRGEVVEWSAGTKRIDPAAIRKLEAGLAENIKSEMESALSKAQWELESDIFGFGFQFSRQHRREWNREFKDRWEELFPSVRLRSRSRPKS